MRSSFLIAAGSSHEHYGAENGPAFVTIVFSVSKSISAVLAGILIGDGRLDPAAPVTRYVPEAKASAWGDATIPHRCSHHGDLAPLHRGLSRPARRCGALSRRHGLEPRGHLQADRRAATILLSLPKGEHSAMRRFHYVSPNSDMLGWILERAGGAPFAELLSRHLWQQMGAECPAFITVDREGAPRTPAALPPRSAISAASANSSAGTERPSAAGRARLHSSRT